MGLTGKVALITGAAQGLGEAFSHTLLRQGVKVAIVDVQEEKGEETVKKLQAAFGASNAVFYKASITNQQEFEGAFESTKAKFGGLDIVINNAGVSGETADRWERTVDINLKGTIRGTLLALDYLRKDKGGRGGVIVNVASVAGIKANPCGPTYAATKSAIVHYSVCWAMNPEVIANGVRINILAPAFVDTSMTENLKNPENSFLPNIADQIIERAGVMTSEAGAASLLELLDEDLNKHKAILAVGEKSGKTYINL